jgi:putative endonuclease
MLIAAIKKIIGLRHDSPKLTEKRKDGNHAEDLAVMFLKRQGLRILARNVNYPCGEIDIVAKEGKVYVFVEVRYRKAEDTSVAAKSITVAKQNRCLAAARMYLSTKTRLPPCRFDAILLNDLTLDAVEWRKSILG